MGQVLTWTIIALVAEARISLTLEQILVDIGSGGMFVLPQESMPGSLLRRRMAYTGPGKISIFALVF